MEENSLNITDGSSTTKSEFEIKLEVEDPSPSDILLDLEAILDQRNTSLDYPNQFQNVCNVCKGGF